MSLIDILQIAGAFLGGIAVNVLFRMFVAGPLSYINESVPICRNRSSPHLCRVAWNRLPKAERPTIDVLVKALKVWNRCAEWKKDGNAYVPGLDKFITQRRWMDLPEVEQAGSRYRNNPKPLPQHDPSEEVTDPAEIAKLLGIKPLRMNS